MSTHPVLAYLMGLRSSLPTPDAVEAWWERQTAPTPAPTPNPLGMCQPFTN
jgi:hypothetical protein